MKLKHGPWSLSCLIGPPCSPRDTHEAIRLFVVCRWRAADRPPWLVCCRWQQRRQRCCGGVWRRTHRGW